MLKQLIECALVHQKKKKISQPATANIEEKSAESLMRCNAAQSQFCLTLPSHLHTIVEVGVCGAKFRGGKGHLILLCKATGECETCFTRTSPKRIIYTYICIHSKGLIGSIHKVLHAFANSMAISLLSLICERLHRGYERST